MSHDIIINFMGKIAVVTGGVGLAAARLFVAEGAHIAITGVTRRSYARQQRSLVIASWPFGGCDGCRGDRAGRYGEFSIS